MPLVNRSNEEANGRHGKVRWRIIVVDDHAGMLEQMVSMLQSDCDVVATAQNGVAALDAVRRFNPDLIVLDISMSPMNGFEVTRQLRESGAKIAIVLVSGYLDREIEQESFTSGADAFVTKSRLQEELWSAVRNAGKRLAERA